MELTARIQKIIKQRDEATRGVDLREFLLFFVASHLIVHLVSTDKVELAADQLVNIEYRLLPAA